MKNIAITKKPNPKEGLVTILEEINSRRSIEYHSKQSSLQKILHDYAFSRLILCAEFHFKPVVNTSYYLYVNENILKLSLIGPKDWKDSGFGVFICQCTLAQTMFWRFSNKSNDPDAADYLSVAVESLKNSLLSDFFIDKPLELTLPYCDNRLSFHRRVLANALVTGMINRIPFTISKSLKQLGNENANEFKQPPFLVSLCLISLED